MYQSTQPLIFSDSDTSDSDYEEDNSDHRGISKNSNFSKLFISTLPEISYDSETHLKRKRKPMKRRKLGTLDENLSKQMGIANEYYLMGSYKAAIPILLNIIKEAPDSVDSYTTLGLIYDHLNMKQKALDLYILAMLLKKGETNNTDRWKELSQMARELNNKEQMLFCYTKILRSSSTVNIDILWQRTMLYKELGDTQKVYSGLLKLYGYSPHDPDIYHHSKFEDDQALKYLSIYLNEFSENKNNTDLNLDLCNISCELFLNSSAFDKVLEVGRLLTSFSTELPIDIVSKIGSALLHLRRIDEAKIYTDILWTHSSAEYSDLYMEVADAYMAIGNNVRAIEILSTVPKSTPQLSIRMGHAHFNSFEFEKALSYYNIACAEDNKKDESRIAKCQALRALGREEEAILTYNDAIETAHLLPMNEYFDINSSKIDPNLLNAMQNVEDQDNVKKEKRMFLKPSNSRDVDIFTKLQKGFYFFEQGNYAGIVELCLPLLKECLRKDDDTSLGFYFPDPINAPSVSSAGFLIIPTQTSILKPETSTPRFTKYKVRLCIEALLSYNLKGSQLNKKVLHKNQWDSFQNYLKEKNLHNESTINDQAHNVSELFRRWRFDNQFNIAEDVKDLKKEMLTLQYRVIYSLCKCLRWAEAYELLAIIFSGRINYNSPDLPVTSNIYRLFCICAVVGLEVGDIEFAYGAVRPLIAYHPEDPKIVELLNKILLRSNYIKKAFRFVTRHISSNSTVCLSIIAGNYLMATKNYGNAAQHYMTYYIKHPDNPRICLALGICYLQHSMCKAGAERKHRHLFVLQAFSFLYKYYHLMKENSEANYNMARAYHYISMNHMCIPYYNKVLEMGEDFVVESAFNLSCIYKAAGDSKSVSIRTLFKYNVVE